MESSQFSYLLSRLFLITIEVLLIIFSIVYINAVYTNNILPDKQVKEDYSATTCLLVSKDLATVGRLIHRYRATFVIAYQVNGTPYKVEVSANGLDQAYFHERGPQEEALADFEVGASYPCWYNPSNPMEAVLVQRHNWMSTLPLLPPTLIALIAFYYWVKGCGQIIGILRESLQNKKKRYKR